MTTRQMKSTTFELLVALVVGTLAAFATLVFLVSLANAQTPDVVYVPPFKPPTPGEYVMGGGLAILLIGACVRALREVFTDTLAPAPSTKVSRGLVLLLSVAAGVLWGLGGVGVPLVAGKIGYVVGGIGLGLLTYVGAKAVPDKARLDTVGRVGKQGKDVPPEAP